MSNFCAACVDRSVNRASRRIQNRIGEARGPLSDALFVPPPPDQMTQALGNLERFMHDREIRSCCGLD